MIDEWTREFDAVTQGMRTQRQDQTMREGEYNHRELKATETLSKHVERKTKNRN